MRLPLYLLLTCLLCDCVNGFMLRNNVPSKILSSRITLPMIPLTDLDLGKAIERIRSLAQDPINGKLAKQMISSAYDDFVWEGILNEKKVSFMPPDATEKRIEGTKQLLESLGNLTLTPTVDHIRTAISSYIDKNGQSAVEIMRLQEQLLASLGAINGLAKKVDTRVESVLIAPRVYETIASSVRVTPSTPPNSMTPMTPQEYLDYLRSTWHLRRSIEENEQAKEIQKILSKSKSLDLNDWYTMNPPGYY